MKEIGFTGLMSRLQNTKVQMCIQPRTSQFSGKVFFNCCRHYKDTKSCEEIEEKFLFIKYSSGEVGPAARGGPGA